MGRPNCACVSIEFLATLSEASTPRNLRVLCARHYISDSWHALERRKTKRQTNTLRVRGDFPFQFPHLVQAMALQLFEASQSQMLLDAEENCPDHRRTRVPRPATASKSRFKLATKEHWYCCYGNPSFTSSRYQLKEPDPENAVIDCI